MSVELHYFDFGGLATALRMCLWKAGVEFKDVRHSWEEMQKLKAEGFFPAGQVPIIIEGGVKLNQSNAMLRYFGSQHGLYGDTPIERYWCDWAIDTFNDLWKPEVYRNFMSDQPIEEEKVKEVIGKFVHFVSQIENRLASGDAHHLNGHCLSIADMKVYAMVGVMLKNIANQELKEKMHHALHEHAPKTTAWCEHMHHAFAGFFEKYPN